MEECSTVPLLQHPSYFNLGRQACSGGRKRCMLGGKCFGNWVSFVDAWKSKWKCCTETELHYTEGYSIVQNMKVRRSRGESGGLKERKLRRGTIWAEYCSTNRANGRRIIHVGVGCFYFHSFIQPSCWFWLPVEYHPDSNEANGGCIIHVRHWQSGLHLLSFLFEPTYCSWLSVECRSIYWG